MTFRMKASLASLALGFGLLPALAAAGPVLAPPIVFEGYVYIGENPVFKGGNLELYARRGSEFVPGLTIKLEDTPAVYVHNCYICDCPGLRPAPGSKVTLSILRNPYAPGARGEWLQVTGTMPGWLAITSPRKGERIPAAGAAELTIAWSGGKAPYTLGIRDVDTRRSVYHAAAIAGLSQSVPMATFTPGKKYRLSVMDAEQHMACSSPVIAGSTFKLGQYHMIEISVE